MNFESVNSVVDAMQRADEANRDQVYLGKECLDFVNKVDGQWEPNIITKFRNRPRYTDDRTNPIINQIVGEVEQSDFTARVRPAGMGSSKDTASVYDGLIRTIRNKSKFQRIIKRTAKAITVTGIGGWEIVKDYAQHDSFHQDLLIKPLEDYLERVTLDPDALNETGDGAMWGVIKHDLGRDQFIKEFGEGANQAGIGRSTVSQTYYYKRDIIRVGQLYYLQPTTAEIVLMSNGAVYHVDDAYESTRDELFEQGIEEVDRREYDTYKCYQRWFGASEWLTDPESVDFDFIPIIPAYGNFEVTEGKITYHGAVSRLMDIQRVHNYAFSRNVEEVALSPRSKWFMTTEQAAGYQDKLKTLNTNMDPIQFYNHVKDQPPPFYSNTSAQNQSVMNLIQITEDGINKAAGIFSANIGDNPGLQSGVAISEQIDRGNNGMSWVFSSLEVAVCRTCELLVRAIPKTYDGTREVLLTSDDGSLEEAVINEPVIDDETQETVYLNDLTKGQYDVICDVGAAYKNRQQEAVEAFERSAAAYPALYDIAADIHIQNLDAPNMDLVAERIRAQMINNGLIPQEQMTDEEMQAYQQQLLESQNNQAPDPQMIALSIQQTQAQTALLAEQNEQARNQYKMQELQIKFAGQQQKTQVEVAEKSANIDQNQQKINLQAQKQEQDAALNAMKLQLEQQQQQFNQMIQAMQAQTDKIVALSDVMAKIKDATGADAIIDPNAVEAYSEASETLSDEIKDD